MEVVSYGNCFLTPLLHLIDDQLSMLWRAIVWNASVLGGNKKWGKISGGIYEKAIYQGSIIQGQSSGWQLFGANYQWSIILRGNSLGVYFLGSNYPGGNCPGAIILGGNCHQIDPHQVNPQQRAIYRSEYVFQKESKLHFVLGSSLIACSIEFLWFTQAQEVQILSIAVSIWNSVLQNMIKKFHTVLKL